MLQKQSLDLSFNLGIDTKSDPKQVQFGKFLELNNSVFGKTGALSKRNGFKNITRLPNALQTTLTTFNDNLLATGSDLYAYSSNTDEWLNKGSIQPINLDVQSLVRSSGSQVAPDIAVTTSGLACTTYTESGLAYYQISDSMTGQQIVNRTALPATATNPRVFLHSRYFMITFVATVSGAPHLQYIAVPYETPANPSVATDISATVSSLQAGYDAVCIPDGNMYVSWAGGSNDIKTAYIAPSLAISSAVTATTHTATHMSVTMDASTGNIWVSFYDSVGQDAYTMIYSPTLAVVLAPTLIAASIASVGITSVAANSVGTIFFDVQTAYSYTPNARTDFIRRTGITQAGVTSGATDIIRSVGLASKAFIHSSGVIYLLVTYGGTNQPTYFLIDSNGNIYMRLAYSNGGGYQVSQVLSNVTLVDDAYHIAYTIKDFLAPVNKETGLVTGTPVNGIYTQTGVNLAMFEINVDGQYSSEIAGSLNLTGGQLWQYDGLKPVEQGFHLYPEQNTVTTSATGGLITAQQYYYQVTYEWTDNNGNLHRSAPSIPVGVVTTGSTSSNTLNIPTLRLTYKVTPNPVRIVIYRWSTAQQTYYQVTSITSPLLNNPSVDSVSFVDTLADSAILGQTLLYTTGGVLENIAPPASVASALFKNRMFIIDAENRNSLWYSKQVLQNTPLEFSDLQTIYVAPTSGAQGSTGNLTALGAMDDKLLMFKPDAIYYLTGNGPDVTGANNDFSEPIFITSSVGTANPDSIVLIPSGTMFQSGKGIWMLGRDLSTTYIGADVQLYNDLKVLSAKVIPGTNQVRFIMENNITLMYDYYYNQWGTFDNISAISSTLFEGADTYLSDRGYIYQETPNYYLDGSHPVLMSFKTSWITLAGIQGYERFYEMYLLGQYFTPFKLNCQIGYDYNKSPSQATLIIPDNYSPLYGDLSVYGEGTYGGPGDVLKARVFPQIQKCESFQISMTEVFDSSYGVVPGAGLSLSGLNMVVGVKRGFRTQKASQSFG